MCASLRYIYIEEEIRNWVNEDEGWKTQVERRASLGKALEPRKQLLYDAWLETKQARRLIFDLKAQRLMKKPSSMNALDLRRLGPRATMHDKCFISDTQQIISTTLQAIPAKSHSGCYCCSHKMLCMYIHT